MPLSNEYLNELNWTSVMSHLTFYPIVKRILKSIKFDFCLGPAARADVCGINVGVDVDLRCRLSASGAQDYVPTWL